MRWMPLKRYRVYYEPTYQSFLVRGLTIGHCRWLAQRGCKRRGWSEQQCRSERV